MNENKVLEEFSRLKIVTIDQLVGLLDCSMITARRRLKKWKVYCSINQNGRYYTLPYIPEFDEKGLWRYGSVLFSKHGNLRRTIVELVTVSPKGLSSAEIAEIVGLAPNSSFISKFKAVAGVKREKHQGRYIYLSDRPEIYTRQKQGRMTTTSDALFPTDSLAVIILVQLIKNPDIDVEQLAEKVSGLGQAIAPASIRRFLKFHDLLKKTPATKS